MSRTIRLILFTLCILVFLLVTPFIVLYAIGYRAPQKSGTVTSPSVGVLIIESFPRRANTLINNKGVGTTPEAVTDLKPGPVNIKVTKEGYLPWEKNINIEPGQVTYLDNIRLFKEEIIPKELSDKVANFSLSPSRDLLAVTDNKNIVKIIDLDGNEIFSSGQFTTSPIKRILWSPDSEYFLAFVGQKTYAFNIYNRNIAPSPINFTSPTEIVWDPRIPGRILVQTNKNNLLGYHISSQAVTTLAEDISLFAPSAKSIFTIDENNNVYEISLLGHLINKYTLDTQEPIKEILVTPTSNIALIFTSGKLAIFTTDNKLLEVTDQVKRAGWSPDGKLLYYQKDPMSIHVYNAFNERLPYLPVHASSLVLRLSRPIDHPQWFAGGHHLIYQTGDEIKITEIDTRDHPITFTLDSTDLGNCQCDVGPDGMNVFYIKANSGRNNLILSQIADKS